MDRPEGNADLEPDVIGELDRAVRTIAAEFAESASRVSLDWTRGVAVRHQNPDRAMTHLADIVVELERIVPNQIEEVLRAAHQGLDELEARTESNPAPSEPAD